MTRDELEHLWVHLHFSLHERSGALDPDEQGLYLILEFEGEVTRGGLYRYLTTPAGDTLPGCLKALKVVGADPVAALIDRARALFPERCPPPQASRRRDHLDRIGDFARTRLSELDREMEVHREDLMRRTLAHHRKLAALCDTPSRVTVPLKRPPSAPPASVPRAPSARRV